MIYLGVSLDSREKVGNQKMDLVRLLFQIKAQIERYRISSLLHEYHIFMYKWINGRGPPTCSPLQPLFY